MLPPQLPQSECVYHGRLIQVHRVQRPDGPPKDLVVHPGAVVVLPLLDARTVVLIRNRRLVAPEPLWELPAGTLEHDEEPIRCAARELAEETGYRPGWLFRLTSFFSSPGFCTEHIHAFVASDLEPVGQNLDAGEHISVHPTPLAEALELIRRGQMCDAKSIATLLFYCNFIQDQHP